MPSSFPFVISKCSSYPLESLINIQHMTESLSKEKMLLSPIRRLSLALAYFTIEIQHWLHYVRLKLIFCKESSHTWSDAKFLSSIHFHSRRGKNRHNVVHFNFESPRRTHKCQTICYDVPFLCSLPLPLSIHQWGNQSMLKWIEISSTQLNPFLYALSIFDLSEFPLLPLSLSIRI